MLADVPDPLKVSSYMGQAYCSWLLTVGPSSTIHAAGGRVCVGICGKDIADCKRNIAAWAEREGATFGH